MKYKHLHPLMRPARLCSALMAGLLTVSAAYPAYADEPAAPAPVYPLAADPAASEPEKDLSAAVLIKKYPRLVLRLLSEEDYLDAVFGSMPRYLDLGSFLLNRLHHIPAPAVCEEGTIVFGSSGIACRRRISMEALQRRIEKYLSGQQGDWSVYLKDLSNGETVSINEHSMQSASLIKLYIAGTTLDRIEKGLLEETDTVKRALDAMITVSDNESSNILVRSFCDPKEDFQSGLAVVNDFIRSCGFVNTVQVNGIADPSLWIAGGGLNKTSTADCGRFLEMVYNGELVSHYASFRLENLLNRQEVNYKIPKGLPEGTHISHKTGEVNDTENDAAIIYTPMGDYILVIMSTDLNDPGAAIESIREITSLVHSWYTSPFMPLDASTLEPIVNMTEEQQYALIGQAVPEALASVIRQKFPASGTGTAN